jgi:hypothetical protein
MPTPVEKTARWSQDRSRVERVRQTRLNCGIQHIVVSIPAIRPTALTMRFSPPHDTLSRISSFGEDNNH